MDSARLGDGTCDAGPPTDADFFCAEHAWDDGDCTTACGDVHETDDSDAVDVPFAEWRATADGGAMRALAHGGTLEVQGTDRFAVDVPSPGCASGTYRATLPAGPVVSVYRDGVLIEDDLAIPRTGAGGPQTEAFSFAQDRSLDPGRYEFVVTYGGGDCVDHDWAFTMACPDATPTPVASDADCPSGYQQDCGGFCVDALVVGDGTCDAGLPGEPLGGHVDLYCQALAFDDGDCASPCTDGYEPDDDAPTPLALTPTGTSAPPGSVALRATATPSLAPGDEDRFAFALPDPGCSFVSVFVSGTGGVMEVSRDGAPVGDASGANNLEVSTGLGDAGDHEIALRWTGGGTCAPYTLTVDATCPEPEDTDVGDSDTDGHSDTGGSDTDPDDCLVTVDFVGTIPTATGTPFGTAAANVLGTGVTGSMTYDRCVTDFDARAQADEYDHQFRNSSAITIELAGFPTVVTGSPKAVLTTDTFTGFTWRYEDGPQLSDPVDRTMSVGGSPVSDLTMSWSISDSTLTPPDPSLPATWPWPGTTIADGIGVPHTFALQDGPVGNRRGTVLIQLTSMTQVSGSP